MSTAEDARWSQTNDLLLTPPGIEPPILVTAYPSAGPLAQAPADEQTDNLKLSARANITSPLVASLALMVIAV
jgi:hypothetical protein